MNANSDEKVENHEDLSDLEEFERTGINIFGSISFPQIEVFSRQSSQSSQICLQARFDVRALLSSLKSKSDQCKRCCATNYHPYKKIPILKWIQEYELRRGSVI